MVIIDVFVIIIALVLGSFFNVVAIRLLKGESFVYPPSHCPSCKHSLSPLDLIPVISYLFLRGRCRYCRTEISPLYPLGELITALSLYSIYIAFGFSLELIPASVLVVVLVLAVMTDLREKVILDKITLLSILVLLILRVFIGEEVFWYYLIGGAVGFSLLLGIAYISKGGMGGGDVKLYAAIGIVLGPWLTLLSLMFASLLGAIIGYSLILTGKVKRKQPIPFAPFIWMGTIISYLVGWEIWNWYINLW